jgi:hypothetical protein
VANGGARDGLGQPERKFLVPPLIVPLFDQTFNTSN